MVDPNRIASVVLMEWLEDCSRDSYWWHKQSTLARFLSRATGALCSQIPTQRTKVSPVASLNISLICRLGHLFTVAQDETTLASKKNS